MSLVLYILGAANNDETKPRLGSRRVVVGRLIEDFARAETTDKIREWLCLRALTEARR